MAAEETREFGAEVGRLLDLVVHSLYSEREIFLRELVANAADATDRRRFLALSDETLALPGNPAVRISTDRSARALTIADSGLGMTKEELAQHLGTIARSGTKAFTETLKDAKAEDRPSLIGQFGVGFYSAFMVSERVDVISRRAGTAEAWRWSSDGTGRYTLSPAERAEPGTDIILHLKPDAEEFLDAVRIETILRKWADHVALPVELEQDGKFGAINQGAALWRKPKSEITPEEYADFFRHLGHIFEEPWATVHWRAEGAAEFSALLFVPAAKPFAPVEEERESKVRLHVRRMFITDQAKLLPAWLRFVDGIVDTEDLPLNVSREMLQSTPVLGRIRKALVNRVLTELKARAKDDAEGFAKFQENFGPILKEGLYDDAEARADIAGLIRFRSSAEARTTLDEYIARLPEGQETIWYLAGDDADGLAQSAQLEGFRAKGIEVLLLPDPIDAFWPGRLETYKGHALKSATQAGDLFAAATADQPLERLCARLASALGEKVSAVVASSRLSESPAVLVAGKGGPDLAMQRVLRRAARPSFGPAPVLEINPTHALILKLAGSEGELGEQAELLLDLARLQDGDLPEQPGQFARRVAAALAAV